MAKFIIQTPNPYFNGVRCGVVFHNGKGETEDETAARALKHEFGYEVQKVAEPKTKAEAGKVAESKARAETGKK